MKSIRSTLAGSLLLFACCQVFADQPVVINNNNNTSPPQQNASNCNNNQQSNSGLRPGTYYKADPQGGMDTVYTTGDKTPYIVDNNNCNQPVVQPYIYGTQSGQAGPPGPPGPPGPGPRGR